MDRSQESNASPPKRQKSQKVSPFGEHATPSENAFAPVQEEGRTRSDGITLHKNYYLQHQIPPMNLSYPQGNSTSSARTNAFLQQRLFEEQKRQEANMSTFLDNSSSNSYNSQQDDNKIFAPSPNPSIQPTYRQTVESKKQKQLDSLIQHGGTYSSTQIANIRRAGAPTPLSIEKGSKVETKNLSPESNSPKKSLFNKIWPTTGPSLKPTPATNAPTPDPTKTSTVSIPVKAAQLLGTKDTTRERTSSPTRTPNKNHQGRSKQEGTVDSEMFFKTPDRLLALASSGARRGTPDQGLLLRDESGQIVRAGPGSSTMQSKSQDRDIPPTPPSKDRPRKPLKIKVLSDGQNPTSTSGPSTDGSNKPSVSTSAQLGEPSPVIGASHQRQYPTIWEVQAGPRSAYGHLDDTANLTPSPSPEPEQRDNTQRHDGDSAVQNNKKQRPQMQSPEVNVIHPSSEMGGLGIIPATVYSPSVYSARGWSRNDAWATPNLYPGPLHVPANVPHHARTSGNSAGSSIRSRDMSNSTSASVPFFLEHNNAQSSSGPLERETLVEARTGAKTTSDALQAPQERASTPHRPLYETLTTQGTVRKASDEASAHSAVAKNGNTMASQTQTHHRRNDTAITAHHEENYSLHSLLTAHFTTITHRIDTLESRLQDLSTHLCGLDTRFTGIDTRFDALGTGLETLDTYMASLDQRLAAVETVVTDHLPLAASRSASEATNARIDALEAKADKSIRLGETALKQLRSTSEYLANVKNDMSTMNHNFVRFVKAQHESASGARRGSSGVHRSASSDNSNANASTNRDNATRQGQSQGRTSGASSGRNNTNNGVSTPSTANSSNGNYQPGSYMFAQEQQQSPHHSQHSQQQYHSDQMQQSPRHRQQSPQYQAQQSPQRGDLRRAVSPQRQLNQEIEQSYIQNQEWQQIQPHPHSSPAGRLPPLQPQPQPTLGSLPTQAYNAYFTSLGRDRSVPDLSGHPAYRQTR